MSRPLLSPPAPIYRLRGRQVPGCRPPHRTFGCWGDRALLLLLLLTAACDWRGYEHERKVKAERAGAVASAVAETQDAFDKLCARDASACWDQLVRTAHRAALGPAPGMTGVTQVCCEVPKTDVSADHSTPSGFALDAPGGTVTVFVSTAGARRPTAALNGTVRGLPAHILTPTSPGQHETVSWTEQGVAYLAVANGVSDADLHAALARLTLHSPK